jgi:hypothetical protein
MNIQKKAAEHTRTAKLHNDTQKQKTKNKKQNNNNNNFLFLCNGRNFFSFSRG